MSQQPPWDQQGQPQYPPPPPTGQQPPPQWGPPSQQYQPPDQQPTQQWSPYQQPAGPPYAPPQQSYPGYPPAGHGKPPKKRHRLRTVLLSALGVVVLIVVVSIAASAGKSASTTATSGGTPPATPAAQATPSPTPDPASTGTTALTVGEPLQVGTGGSSSTAATITITKVQVTTQPADPSVGQAPQNGYYVIATVTVRASQDGFNVNALDFYCLTHGQHYDEGDGNAFEAVDNPADITSTLNSGETATGQEVFDVPHPHGKIVYSPNFDGAPIAYWTY